MRHFEVSHNVDTTCEQFIATNARIDSAWVFFHYLSVILRFELGFNSFNGFIYTVVNFFFVIRIVAEHVGAYKLLWWTVDFWYARIRVTTIIISSCVAFFRAACNFASAQLGQKFSLTFFVMVEKALDTSKDFSATLCV